MQPPLTDRTALLRNRNRAAKDAFFLFETARDDLEDRLSMVNRSFTAPAIVTHQPALWRDRLPNAVISGDSDILELSESSHDLVVHSHALHWADDPVGQLVQCRRALKPDGFFLASFFGGQTLKELRATLAQAESDLTGGLSPRVVPMAEIRESGALLQRAGFSLPVADTYTLSVSYQSPFDLMHELRNMGEANALTARLRAPTRRRVLLRAAELYVDAFGADGRIPATFDIVVLTGWSPDSSQPQPLRPGSAKTRLADVLGTDENKLND